MREGEKAAQGLSGTRCRVNGDTHFFHVGGYRIVHGSSGDGQWATEVTTRASCSSGRLFPEGFGEGVTPAFHRHAVITVDAKRQQTVTVKDRPLSREMPPWDMTAHHDSLLVGKSSCQTVLRGPVRGLSWSVQHVAPFRPQSPCVPLAFRLSGGPGDFVWGLSF